MEREVGGGIGMGNTCKPMAVSFQCMTKFTTKKKINMVSMWACIFSSFHLQHKVICAVLFCIRKNEKEKEEAADLSCLSSVSGLSGQCLCIKS